MEMFWLSDYMAPLATPTLCQLLCMWELVIKYHHFSNMGNKYVQFDPKKDIQKYMATYDTILL